MKELELIDHTVVMRKHLFGPNEIALANCMWFPIAKEGNITVIKADLKTTTKIALHEFIKECFRGFCNNADRKSERDMFFGLVKDKYAELYQSFENTMLPTLGYQDKLYKHQKDGIFDCAFKKYNFIAYQMRLGKSIVSASLSKIFKIKRTLIICPAVVKYNWMNDLVNSFGYNPLYFTVLDATKRRTLKAFQERFVIVNYDILDKTMDHILKEPIGHIIIDESSAIKNTSTTRSKALKHIVEKNPDARITFLDGTPVKNRINDMFNYLKLVGHPLGKNYSLFLREYTISSSIRGQINVKGSRNLEDLYKKMSNFVLRKTMKECLDMPDKIYSNIYLSLDEYKKEYDEIVEQMFKENRASSLHSNLHSLNLVTAKSKVKGAIEMVDMLIGMGKKVIVFGSYKEPLKMVQDYYKERCVLIDGSVSSFDREALVQKFREDDNVEVFVGNMQAAGVGINLSVASDIVYLNFPFVPSDLDQSGDRASHMTKRSDINIYYTIAKDSIDEYIYDIIKDKSKDIRALIDRGKEVVEYENIPDRLFREVMENYKKTHPQLIEATNG